MSQLARIRSEIALNPGWKWAEYILLGIIAGLIVLSTVTTDFRTGLFIAIICIGLIFLLACLYDIRIGFYGMIVLGFLSAFIGRLFSADLSIATVLLLLPFALFAIILIKDFRKKEKPWMIWHPIILIYFITVAYIIVQVFNPQMDSLLGWLSYFRGSMSITFTIIVWMYILKDIRDVRFFFKFIIGALFVTAFYGCYQKWLGFTSFEMRWIYSTPGALGLYSLPGEGMRRFSFLTDPANFGTLMASGALGTLILALGPFKKSRKVLLGIFTAVILLGMSYSGTRTASLMLLAGLVLYILLTFYQKRTRILACCAGIVFLFILHAPIYGNVTLNRLRSAFRPPSNDASYDIRNVHRHMMQPYMHSHPFGGGVNTTMGAGIKYNPHHILAGFPPDSTYFATALERGWVGLALQCIFFFIILFYSIHYFYKCRNKEIKTYYAATTVMLFSIMLGAYTQFTFTSIPQNFIFFSFVAIIIKLHTFDTPELSKT